MFEIVVLSGFRSLSLQTCPAAAASNVANAACGMAN
jgi:hypothetical protein